MLTRAQVAKRLSKSIATVRRLEGTKLHPIVTGRGVRLFSPEEVEALADEARETGRVLSPSQLLIPNSATPGWNDYEELQAQLEAAQDESRNLRTQLDAATFQAESNERQLARLRREILEWAAMVDQGYALLVQAESDEIQAIALDALIEVMGEVPE